MDNVRWAYKLYELHHESNRIDTQNWLRELDGLGGHGWEAITRVDMPSLRTGTLAPHLLLKRPIGPQDGTADR